MKNFTPLTSKEQELLKWTKIEIMKTWKDQTKHFDLLDTNSYHVPISAIIRAYNSLLIQPNPYFGAELNYYKSFRSAYDREYETADYSSLNKSVGFDFNQALKEAIELQTKNNFQSYIE